MYWNKRVLAIVPARGGSTGIKDKNIKLFNGRPLIYWALDALTFSNICDKIIVSTDSDKIAEEVIKYGSGVEVARRPKELATNTARVMDTMQYHVTNNAEVNGETFDYVVMHHATAPLCTDLDIRHAFKTLIKEKADFIISMVKSPTSLGISRPVLENKSVRGWFPKEWRGLNRQELPVRYELDNNIYIGKWEIFRDNVDYWETNIIMYEMPDYKRADIDTMSDFRWAEMQLRRNQEWHIFKSISDFKKKLPLRSWSNILRGS